MELEFDTDMPEASISTILSIPVTEEQRDKSREIKSKSKKHKKLYSHLARQAIQQINDSFERGEFDSALNKPEVL